MTDDAAVRLQGVTKTFGDHVAVSGLDLTIPRGSVYGLLGPNGSGKSTTIRMIVGILGPDQGTIELLGRRPDAAGRRRVGYLPEERGLYPAMKVLEVLSFLAEIRGFSRTEGKERAQAWLDRLELSEWADHRVRDLSKGMQQKVQFIGTVLHEPELLILDEPFSGLDPLNQEVLERMVREFRERGTTILFSTHLMDQAERMCDAVCLISSSQKVLDGNLKDLKRADADGVIALRFQGEPDWIEGPDIRSWERKSADAFRVLVEDGADPRNLLRRGVEAGVQVERFEVVEPSLHEIFVKHASAVPGTQVGAEVSHA